MKTTVKTQEGRIVVMPVCGAIVDALMVSVVRGDGQSVALSLTADQAGALIFGLEQAMEVIDQRNRATLEGYRAKYEAKQAGGVRCHGDLCAGGQVACPSPKACGVA